MGPELPPGTLGVRRTGGDGGLACYSLDPAPQVPLPPLLNDLVTLPAPAVPQPAWSPQGSVLDPHVGVMDWDSWGPHNTVFAEHLLGAEPCPRHELQGSVTVVLPDSQVRNLRLREANSLAQGCTALVSGVLPPPEPCSFTWSCSLLDLGTDLVRSAQLPAGGHSLGSQGLARCPQAGGVVAAEGKPATLRTISPSARASRAFRRRRLFGGA